MITISITDLIKKRYPEENIIKSYLVINYFDWGSIKVTKIPLKFPAFSFGLFPLWLIEGGKGFYLDHRFQSLMNNILGVPIFFIFMKLLGFTVASYVYNLLLILVPIVTLLNTLPILFSPGIFIDYVDKSWISYINQTNGKLVLEVTIPPKTDTTLHRGYSLFGHNSTEDSAVTLKRIFRVLKTGSL